MLVFGAARTGWLPASAEWDRGARQLIIPVVALAMPMAAMFERLQSQAMREVMSQPYILAAFARGGAARADRLARRVEGRTSAGGVGENTAWSWARCSADRSPWK